MDAANCAQAINARIDPNQSNFTKHHHSSPNSVTGSN
jgi:hypothetical protein